MEERNTISYEEKERKKGSENDMEKITWASRKTTTTNKSIFFQRGEKNQMVPDFLKTPPSNTTMEQHFKKTQGNIV